MTEIAFHFNAPDKLQYSCRLLRKAYAQDKQVVVTGPETVLTVFDTLLWTFSAIDFIAHCHVDLRPECVAFSPVLLCPADRDLAAWAPERVLVNLGPEIPTGFEQFTRCIEVVAHDEADRQAGRQRWKHYSAQGWQPHSYDVATGAGAA